MQDNSKILPLNYALPVISIAWLMAPISILQGIYAKYYGLPLATIASVFLLTRLFDAVSDPIIGYISDRYYYRNKSYKPFIFAGGTLFVVSSYYLYTPPSSIDASYFTFWLLMFYFSWTLFEMPHLAWASELAHTSKKKAEMYSYRNMAVYVGFLLFYSVPLLPIFETRDITPATLKVSTLMAGLLMLPFLIICLVKVKSSSIPAGEPNCGRAISGSGEPKAYEFFRALLTNKPLLIFIGAYLLIIISSGMWYSLIFLYVDSYLGLGEKFAEIFLIAFGVGILATPLWYKLSVWLGKKTTLILAALLLIYSYIYTVMLSPFQTSFTELVLLKTIQTLGFVCSGIVAPTILSEIIDYSSLRYGVAKNASYFAVYNFTHKTTFAIATALGLGIASAAKFDATSSTHSAESILGMQLAIGWIPSLFAMLAIIAISLIPMNERRHAIVRRRLDSRLLRSELRVNQ